MNVPEPLCSLRTAAVLLAVAAVGGIVMALIRFRGAPRPPSSIAFAHGLLAAGALTLLLYFGFTTGIPAGAMVGTAVLITAALIGTWLNLRFHSQLQPLPIAGILVHALVAVVGFVFLLFALMNIPA